MALTNLIRLWFIGHCLKLLLVICIQRIGEHVGLSCARRAHSLIGTLPPIKSLARRNEASFQLIIDLVVDYTTVVLVLL